MHKEREIFPISPNMFFERAGLDIPGFQGRTIWGTRIVAHALYWDPRDTPDIGDRETRKYLARNRFLVFFFCVL